VLDYHLHLWPHEESSVDYHLEQVAAYCEEAATQGVSEIALTEHAFRFREIRATVGSFWERWGYEPTSQLMADYFDFHARNALEDYVTLAQAAKDAGLPVKIGLEVDYYADQMDDVGVLLAQYPFDVLIGSVHWLNTWQFDVLDDPDQMAQWHTRDVATIWNDYADAFTGLVASGVVDVVAHPDVIKVAGFVPESTTDVWERMAVAAAAGNVAVECSSAGWFKPVGEQYPAGGLLDRFVAAGVDFTTASDAHRLERVGARSADLAALLEARGVHQLASFDARQKSLVPLRSLS
jgi:histidinol-phosphatase (PHP family)